MAKAVDNGKAQPGKGTPAGKPGRTTGTASKRAGGKTQAQAKARASSGKSGEKRSLGKFLREVRIELRKVTWPTRKDLLQSTIVVLVAVSIATVYVFVLDTAFSRFVDLVLRVIT